MAWPHRGEERAARATRKVAMRAVRRLDVLEWVILAGAALVAIVGGALVAALLHGTLAVPFSIVWIVTSVLLFGVPGALSLRRVRAEEARGEDTDS